MEVTLLSHSISTTTPLYGGTTPSITTHRCMDAGDSSNSLMLTMPNHTSTHVDVPFHFVATGKKITDYSAKDWLFKHALLVSCTAGEGSLVTIEDLDLSGLKKSDYEAILIKTGFERYRGEEKYWASSPGLAPGLYDALKARFPRLRAVGMDFISTSSYLHREAGRVTHREFLGGGVLLIEDMKLGHIKNSPDSLIVSPLLIENGDGAPVTVFGFFGTLLFS